MKKIIYSVIFAAMLAGCNDFLDRAPESNLTPEVYLNNEKHLEAYAANRYTSILSHSSFPMASMLCSDTETDDKINRDDVPLYKPGETRVPEKDGSWNFKEVRSCNYFFDQVLPKYESNQISGDKARIEHCIGEMHFFRAYEYFKLLQDLGDLPIVKSVPEMDAEQLTEDSKRQPRSEVVRFILKDLDDAITLLMDKSPDNGRKNRLSKDVARLFKSRVALFEASWLRNFDGTAFVPNGEGWPGKSMHPDYQFQAGSLSAEVDWLLQQAIDAAGIVADNHPILTQNTYQLQQSIDEPVNPFFNMFTDMDLSGYDEVLLWRDYDDALGVLHGAGNAGVAGNHFHGITKGLVDCFLMKDGRPIYDTGTDCEYMGDDDMRELVKNRDNRLQLFLKIPGQINKIVNEGFDPPSPTLEEAPRLFHTAFGYVTGYCIRKYGSLDGNQSTQSRSSYGCPLFRSVEAYLNYIEAYYMKNDALDTKALDLWEKIRIRAGVDFEKTNYMANINHTNMEKESEGDWGAYTAGQLLTDKVMYNIRRERRCELMSEGFRLMDLKRWRSMDQLMDKPYIIRGFNLWGGVMEHWYDNEDGTSQLITSGNKKNVSSPEDGDGYYCPHRVNPKHMNYNGYSWAMAHYLDPIAAKHFQLTGGEKSTIYQNPGWGVNGGEGALK